MSDPLTPPTVEPGSPTPPKRNFLRKIWALAGPYFSSEERIRARLMLAGLIGLTLMQIAVQIRFNGWNGDFFNALEQRDQSAFFRQVLVFAAIASASMGI